MNFGRILNNILREKGISPAELSRTLDWNTGAISQYMNNPDRVPTLKNAIKIADALDVSLDYLAGRDAVPVRYTEKDKQRLNDGFDKLNRDGRMIILDQVKYQLTQNSKNEDMSGDTIQGIA